MMRRRRVESVCGAALLLLLALPTVGLGAAAEGPSKFTTPDGACTVTVPAGWKRLESQGYLMLMDFGPSMAALAVYSEPRQARDLNHLAEVYVGQWKQQQKAWAEVSRQDTKVGSFPARRVRATFDLEGVKTAGDLCMVLTPRHHIRLLFQCPADKFDAAKPKFDEILRTVAIHEQGATPPPPPPPQPAHAPPAAPGASVKHLGNRVTSVTDEHIVVRGQFEIHNGQQQWFSVYFQVRHDADKAVTGADGKPILRKWADLFPPANAGVARFDDVRIGILLSDLSGATSLSRGARTKLGICCDVWDQTSGKYLGHGWPVHAAVFVTTDANGKVVKVEAPDLEQ